MIEPKFSEVPELLQNINQWVLWKIVVRGGKETKIPWSVFDQPASSTDPATWSTFESVVMRYQRGYHAGIGFVFERNDGLAGIDLDSCRNPETGEIAGWAQQWIDKSEDAYAEVSPSETGVKIWIKADMHLEKGRNIKIDEQPLVPGKKPGIEIYTHGRYFAVTGHKIKGFAS
jgi:primase-polymerase (primpol)-like protein